MPNPDLKECVDALAKKLPPLTARWRYYDGDHPLAFTNPKMGEVISNGVVFKKNWCQVIVNAVRDRLNIQSWNTDGAPSEDMDDIWKRILKRLSRAVHVSALTTGEGYVVAWEGADGDPVAFYHDPRQVHAIYADDNPDAMRCACKTWLVKGASNVAPMRYLNIYYPDRIEHYQSQQVDGGASTSYVPTLPGDAHIDANQFGEIPVFHFIADKRTGLGELTAGILSLQDALNKLLNDMMVASEFTAFPQRYAIGNFDDKSKIQIGPGTAWLIPPGVQGEQPSSAGTFATMSPDNYLRPMDDIAGAMAALSATPKHYLFLTGGDPSGEALQTMESSLIAKITSYQETLGDTWRRLGSFLLRVKGKPVDDLECIWADPHTTQEYTRAQTRLVNVNAGIPIVNQLRDEGWTEEQIEQLHRDANVTNTMAAIPNPSLIPRNVGGPVRQEAMKQAKEKLAARNEGALADALTTETEASVDAMVKSGALADVMKRNEGKAVRK